MSSPAKTSNLGGRHVVVSDVYISLIANGKTIDEISLAKVEKVEIKKPGLLSGDTLILHARKPQGKTRGNPIRSPMNVPFSKSELEQATTIKSQIEAAHAVAMKNETPIAKLEGITAFVTLYPYKITISPDKGWKYFQGDKDIWLTSVTGVEYKEEKRSNGYIQFVIQGGQDRQRGMLGALDDENAVFFKSKFNANAERFKELLDRQLMEIRRPQAPTVQSSISVTDELAKIAVLRDQGSITEDQFVQLRNRLISP